MKHYSRYFGFGALIALMAVSFMGAYGRKALVFLVILAALFLLFIVRADAQTKTEPPKPTKPTFESSLSLTDIAPFSITGGFTLQQTNDFLMLESVGLDNLSHSKDITAAEFTRMKQNHDIVRDSLIQKVGHMFNKYLQARRNKFTADTLAQYHHK
jgi:Ca2+/Na+ antiporter